MDLRSARILVAAAAATLAAHAAPPAGHAQDAGTGGVRLTLAEAVRRAERNNPEYRSAVNALELNTVEQRDAWLQLLPRPQLSLLSTSVSWNLQHVGTDPFGNPLPNPEATTVQSSQSRQQAALSFSFSAADYLRFAGRGDNAHARTVTAENRLHQLHAEVWRSYLDVQHHQVTVALEEELLGRQRENREIARRLYALAQRERIDLLEADLEVAMQEERLRQTRAEQEAALLRLRTVIGDAALHVEAVEPIELGELDPDGLNEDALVRAALAASPALALEQAEIRRARQQVAETRWQQWLPTVSVGFSTSRNELARDGGDAFFQMSPSGGWDRNVTLAVSFPDLGRALGSRNTLRGQQVGLRNANESLRQRRLDVEQGVRRALLELSGAHASVGLQERRVALAEERLAARIASYRLGRGTYQDLQTATDAVADAERALLTARHRLEHARVSLEQAVGTPLRAGVAGTAADSPVRSEER